MQKLSVIWVIKRLDTDELIESNGNIVTSILCAFRTFAECEQHLEGLGAKKSNRSGWDYERGNCFYEIEECMFCE